MSASRPANSTTGFADRFGMRVPGARIVFACGAGFSQPASISFENTLLNKMRVFKTAMAFLMVLLAMEASAMGLNKILFSNVHGVVLERGKPVPDALVTRYFNFGLTDESETDTTRTDSKGVFTFLQIGRLSLLASIVPAQPDVPQKISITHGGKEYLAWLFTKKNYDANGELHGKPIDLLCELTNERTYDETTKVHGICQLK